MGCVGHENQFVLSTIISDGETCSAVKRSVRTKSINQILWHIFRRDKLLLQNLQSDLFYVKTQLFKKHEFGREQTKKRQGLCLNGHLEIFVWFIDVVYLGIFVKCLDLNNNLKNTYKFRGYNELVTKYNKQMKYSGSIIPCNSDICKIIIRKGKLP